jgi:glutathione-independent formaldehyde dehydrogenase
VRELSLTYLFSFSCLFIFLPSLSSLSIPFLFLPFSTVYVAGAGPVGLAAAASCQLLGAGIVIVGDMNKVLREKKEEIDREKERE